MITDEQIRAVGRVIQELSLGIKIPTASHIRLMLEAAAVAAWSDNIMPSARDIIAERQRQIFDEGWTLDHDDRHDGGDLARAAACYAFNASGASESRASQMLNLCWPWSTNWWKPTDHRRNLVKAGALILAEIERLDRMPPPKDDASSGPAPARDEKTEAS